MRSLNNKNISRLLNILQDGHYHDGNSMGKKLGLTRSAIWKIIKKCQQLGIQIASIKGKGYILLEEMILLDETILKQQISSSIDLHLFESIHSTNDYLKSFSTNQTQICLAEHQSKGKGRLGRTWHSPFAKNLMFSCRYVLRKDVSALAGLSLLTSLSIIDALTQLGLSDGISVKWPNDIFYHHQKLSGTLIEIQAESHGMSVAIIGIGMNVNAMLDNNEHEITKPWTSLRQITGKYIDRNILAGQCIHSLLKYLHQFELNGFAPYIESWQEKDLLYNKEICVKHLQNEIKGKMVGVNEQGYLLLELSSGVIQTFSSGDTSIVRRIGRVD